MRIELKAFLGFCLLFLSLTLARPVWAVSEFTAVYDSTYLVSTNGVTTVTHKVSLKNNLSSVYANQFTLILSLTDIRNIKVRDSVGLIEPTVTKLENQSQIQFPFAAKVVGKDKVNEFSITYQTSDIAIHTGAVWEINIPRLESGISDATHNTTLVIPGTFGQPAFISPSPTSRNNVPDLNNNVSYAFSDTNAVSKPVSAVFGREQFLDFSLSYHLENPGPAPAYMEVALPPDTAYQTVAYKQIIPAPVLVHTDMDGNWLARFKLDSLQQLDITAQGLARLSFAPQVASLSADPSTYLKPTDFWPTQADQVKSLSDKLRTPLSIYQYIDDFLKYDYSRVEAGGGRKGALQALSDPTSAICTEYTDLFITLARAAGIPARELEGFAFTTNSSLRPLSLTQDILHAWPEYFNPETKIWTQIDPTWGDTTGGIDYFHKLDLNHFVFAIHGSDPQKPLPAGAYKLKDKPQKDVSVVAVDAQAFPTPQFTFQKTEDSSPTKPVILVKNIGQVAGAPSISLKSDPVGIINEQQVLPSIPPYGEMKLTLSPNIPWSIKPLDIVVTLSYDRNYTFEFQVQRPLPTAAKVGICAVGGLLVILTLFTGRLYLRRRKPDPTIYW